MKKGQVITILAILVVVVLFLLKADTYYTGFTETSYQSSYLFENMENEIKKSSQISIWKDNITIVKDFSDFLRQDREIHIFYVVSDFRDSTLNISVFNFLGEGIKNIEIEQNLTDESDSISSLDDGNSSSVDFTWSGSETDFQINVTYEFVSGGEQKNYTFNSLAGPLKYKTFLHEFNYTNENSYKMDIFTVSGQVR